MTGSQKTSAFNTILLSIVSVIMIGSLTMNVQNFSSRIGNNEETGSENSESTMKNEQEIRELNRVFSDMALVISAMAQDIKDLEERAN